jgi:PAT family beta-lactamase induction signal transducer AmpG
MFGVWGQRKMLALLLLGFSSGLPLYLTSKALQAWMTLEQVDLTTIGAFSLVALPYSLKFMWAPLVDRYIPPFLGRRRGWVIIAQFALMLAIAAMSLHDPRLSLQLLAVNAVLIAFFSATQDVALDAYRTDVLAEKEMGAGAAIFVLGYRAALLLTGGLALVLADYLSWPTVYVIMGALMLLSMIVTWRSPEPVMAEAGPQSLGAAVRLPFKDFFQRAGPLRAMLVLAFIVIYKLPEYMAQNMALPFLLQTGFSQTEVGAVQGGIGLVAVIIGSLVVGGLVVKYGINRTLWIAGIVGAAANILFYLLAVVGKSYPLLFTSVIVENFCFGMVNGVFVAFMMSMCSPRFSATQYALLSSLMSASRDIVVSPSGAIAEAVGWPGFFLISLAAVLPGLALLPFFAPWNRQSPLLAVAHTGATVELTPEGEALRAPSEK